MNKVNKKVIFEKINSEMHKTLVFSFLDANGLKKENNCAECDGYCGSTIDCYACLLPDAKLRKKVDNVIDNVSAKDLYKYQETLDKKAEDLKNKKYKRVSEIIESAVYLKSL